MTKIHQVEKLELKFDTFILKHRCLDNKTTIEADDAASAEDNGLLLHITLQMAIMTMLSSQALDFVILYFLFVCYCTLLHF